MSCMKSQFTISNAAKDNDYEEERRQMWCKKQAFVEKLHSQADFSLNPVPAS